jgi:hypothetical protein
MQVNVYTPLKKYNNACALKFISDESSMVNFIIRVRAMKITRDAITVCWQAYSVAFISN